MSRLKKPRAKRVTAILFPFLLSEVKHLKPIHKVIVVITIHNSPSLLTFLRIQTLEISSSLPRRNPRFPHQPPSLSHPCDSAPTSQIRYPQFPDRVWILKNQSRKNST
ncbi:hypothetical protein RJT34_22686 [Clitoria ternatea]|uniref:Uncharacterized protein n=1 Tax=Clitoria ternatea TaxID=43366 RepID=A0AAN9FLX6_CLITE